MNEERTGTRLRYVGHENQVFKFLEIDIVLTKCVNQCQFDLVLDNLLTDIDQYFLFKILKIQENYYMYICSLKSFHLKRILPHLIF